MSDQERCIEAIELLEETLPNLSVGEIATVAATIANGHLTGSGDLFVLLLKGKDV